MARKHRPQDNPDWIEMAPKADKKAWRKEYNRLFRENLKQQPTWLKAKQSGQIELNASQTEALNLIKTLAVQGDSILDVGSGPGFLTHALLSSGYDAYGCDCAEEAVKFAGSLGDGTKG